MRKITDHTDEEILCYVIALEQPFVNWFGVIRAYDVDNNLCEVEDEDGKIHTVRLSDVRDNEDCATPIIDILKAKITV